VLLAFAIPGVLGAGRRPAAANAYGSFVSSLLRLFDVTVGTFQRSQ